MLAWLVEDTRRCDKEWLTLVVAITTHVHKVGSGYFTMKLQPQDMGENKSVIRL